MYDFLKKERTATANKGLEDLELLLDKLKQDDIDIVKSYDEFYKICDDLGVNKDLLHILGIEPCGDKCDLDFKILTLKENIFIIRNEVDKAMIGLGLKSVIHT